MLYKIIFFFQLLLYSFSSIYSYSVTEEIKEKGRLKQSRNILIEQNRQLSLIASEAFPAIVNISSTRKINYDHISPFQYFFDTPFFDDYSSSKRPGRKPRERREKSLGSGFIISNDGYVLTNYHVVKYADEVVVILHDGQEKTARLIGTDKKTDVALLKIEGSNFPYLDFGDSDKALMGELVMALGNPFSVGVTFTTGVISAKGRNAVGINAYEDFIQTDAAINPGNSGGPLLNVMGEVIGMNTAILSRSGGSQGVGFAIPVNMCRSIVSNLKKFGKVKRAYLGVNIQDLDQSMIKGFGLKQSQKGALVSHVFEGSPAHKAGIEPGDIILRFNNRAVVDSPSLRNVVALSQQATSIPVEILRDNRRVIKDVVLVSRDKASHSKGEYSDHTLLGGVILQDLTSALRRDNELPRYILGVFVQKVSPDSKAAKVGFRSGDIIQSVNKVPISNLKRLDIELSRAGPYVFLVYRDGVNYFIVIE